MKKIFVLSVLIFLLAGCQQGLPAVDGTTAEAGPTSEAGVPEAAATQVSNGMGMGMGRASGMGSRHHAVVPEPYAGIVNEMEADEASLERGAQIFTTLCISCHGEDGMGNGPAAAELNPAPAPIARTSQMMSDAYLLWRISEGGVPFETQMPVWKDTLNQQQIWDVINYVRALGTGAVHGGMGMGQQNAGAEAAQHAEMLAKGVEQGVITQVEADIFNLVHHSMETFMIENSQELSGVEDRQAYALTTLVESGTLTQAQVDTFQSVHDRLMEAGLMQ